MPFDYERDEARRRVTVTYGGTFETADGLAILDRHRREDIDGFGILYDLSGLTGHPTTDDMRLFLREEERVTDAARGPIALVANDPTIYAMACTFAALARGKFVVEVFRDRREAELWLDSLLKIPKGRNRS